jgi:hypothetical protein
MLPAPLAPVNFSFIRNFVFLEQFPELLFGDTSLLEDQLQ